MQTIKKVKYNIERVGNNTFCTMSCDLKYIMDYLEGANVEVSSADTSVFVKILASKERKIFIKNLASWGLTVDNSTITVVTKITLSKNDKDDQVVANRIVRDKAMHTMCKVVANALDQALESTYNRLAKVKVKVVNGGTFNIIKESLIKKGISKNQIKMPRVINDKKEILKILMSKTI